VDSVGDGLHHSAEARVGMVGQRVTIFGRDGDELGESAGAMHAHQLSPLADVALAELTPSAGVADDERVDGDFLTDAQIRHAFAQCDDGARKLMPHNQRRLSAGMALDDAFQLRTANADMPNAD
jgi:hypothetical protein